MRESASTVRSPEPVKKTGEMRMSPATITATTATTMRKPDFITGYETKRAADGGEVESSG
ncbi:hypothetical protein GCM10027169_28020 [Gordonia jinhuaensis]|uniref:Uncharacterized protein n=1 Tax=Gordonia jinhuaensis TaxID=1517702 RepID=A0A916T9M2_9ACTN|nr:hypothetical protein GCM10011489_26110 [Gordonia jinhuaensis]